MHLTSIGLLISWIIRLFMDYLSTFNEWLQIKTHYFLIKYLIVYKCSNYPEGPKQRNFFHDIFLLILFTADQRHFTIWTRTNFLDIIILFHIPDNSDLAHSEIIILDDANVFPIPTCNVLVCYTHHVSSSVIIQDL